MISNNLLTYSSQNYEQPLCIGPIPSTGDKIVNSKFISGYLMEQINSFKRRYF